MKVDVVDAAVVVVVAEEEELPTGERVVDVLLDG